MVDVFRLSIVDRELCGMIAVANSGVEIIVWRIVVSPEVFADSNRCVRVFFEYIGISCGVT